MTSIAIWQKKSRPRLAYGGRGTEKARLARPLILGQKKKCRGRRNLGLEHALQRRAGETDHLRRGWEEGVE